MKVDFFAREKHHIEHAKAIYNKLPEDIKGQFIDNVSEMNLSPNKIVACFCYGDLKLVAAAGKKAIYGDHGVGMWYNVEHPSYAGSVAGRENVVLRLSPNSMHAEKERSVMSCPVEVIGVPKMDKYHSLRGRMRRVKRPSTIAISFHWDCRVCPETRSAFRYYIRTLKHLGLDYKVMGHAHPRIFKSLEGIYRNSGVKPVEEFDDVMRKADVYICDNSSTIFEFAYTGKPVILLNMPAYRKDVEHEGNPRFWKYANIGLQVDHPEDLLPAIRLSLENYRKNGTPEFQEEVSEKMFYKLDGKSSDRAAEVISSFMKTYVQ